MKAICQPLGLPGFGPTVSKSPGLELVAQRIDVAAFESALLALSFASFDQVL